MQIWGTVRLLRVHVHPDGQSVTLAVFMVKNEILCAAQ